VIDFEVDIPSPSIAPDTSVPKVTLLVAVIEPPPLPVVIFPVIALFIQNFLHR